MRSKAIEAYKATLSLTPIQEEVLVGLMLGDGHLELRESSRTLRARLKFEQRASAREYVQWMRTIFKPWIHGPMQTKTCILKTTGKRYRKYYFNTYTHEKLLPHHRLFYQDRRKIVPPTIGELLTPLGLAVWFMDDGSIKSHQSRGRILNTHAFSLAEIKLLCSVLQEKFHLEAWPRYQRDGIQIYISGTSSSILQELLVPHVIPMMRYKLPLPFTLTNVPKL